MGASNLPESTGGEAWGCKDSREGGVQRSVVLASTVLRGNQKQWSARWGHLIQIVERRFLCFVSLSPLDKEMKSRHGQWLIVIKNLANIEPALTSAAATRHRPRPRPPPPPAAPRPLKTPSANGNNHAQWSIPGQDKPRERLSSISPATTPPPSASDAPCPPRKPSANDHPRTPYNSSIPASIYALSADSTP